MEIKPIKNSSDYRATLGVIESLMFAKKGSKEGEKLDLLVTLIEAYEQKKFSLDLPDAIEAIVFEMERKNLEAIDLVPMIGHIDNVHEVLNRKRPLTLRMIRNLHKDLGIPAEILIK